MLYCIYNTSDAKLGTIKTVSIILTSNAINKIKLGLDFKKGQEYSHFRKNNQKGLFQGWNIKAHR